MPASAHEQISTHTLAQKTRPFLLLDVRNNRARLMPALHCKNKKHTYFQFLTSVKLLKFHWQFPHLLKRKEMLPGQHVTPRFSPFQLLSQANLWKEEQQLPYFNFALCAPYDTVKRTKEEEQYNVRSQQDDWVPWQSSKLHNPEREEATQAGPPPAPGASHKTYLNNTVLRLQSWRFSWRVWVHSPDILARLGLVTVKVEPIAVGALLHLAEPRSQLILEEK